jgi:hypothetical protein
MLNDLSTEVSDIVSARSDSSLVTFDYNNDGNENQDSYVDLAHVCQLLIDACNSQVIKDAAAQVDYSIETARIALTNVGSYYTQAGGLSVYYPNHEPDLVGADDYYANYQNTGDAANLDFVADTRWDEFLAALLQLSAGADRSDRLPLSYCLRSTLPNPFVSRTTIGYDVPMLGPLNLSIYDVGGRLVRRLIDSPNHPGGRHNVVWDGMSDDMQFVVPGIYFCHMEAGSYRNTKKLVLLR